MNKNNHQHYLITQFNLTGLVKFQDTRAWNEWNIYRFDFFKRYSLPSVLNQSNKDFIWFIFFDKSTPVECLRYIDELKQYKFIIPIIINGITEFRAECIKSLKKYLKKDYEWILTTRLDNDDALHYSAIDTIQNCFTPVDQQLIILASGYVCDFKTKKLSHYYYFKSPFLTVIERNNKDDIKGVFFHTHTEWPNLRFRLTRELKHLFIKEIKSKPIYIVDKPYWVQFIHNNLSNSFYRGVPVLHSLNLTEFGLPIKTEKGNFFSFPKYYNYYLWKRYIRGVILKNIHIYKKIKC